MPKSLFLSAWLAFLIGLSIYLGGLLLLGAWFVLPLLYVSLLPLVFIGNLYVQKQGRTSPLLPAWSISLSLALVLSVRHGLQAPVLFAATGLAYVGWWVYILWYSRLQRPKQSPFIVGQALPEFELMTQSGQLQSSLTWTQAPALWLFFRGNWCPLCMAQIHEIAKYYQRLSALGVQLILVSGQSEHQTRKLAQRFDVPFIFLRDPDLKAAKKLGVFHEKGLPTGMQVLGYDSDTLFPTVLITDAQGVLRFADQTDNYRVRPEPQQFLPIFEQMESTR